MFTRLSNPSKVGTLHVLMQFLAVTRNMTLTGCQNVAVDVNVLTLSQRQTLNFKTGAQHAV